MLTPDFRGQEMPLARVIAERPDVFNHNVETVPRLYPLARRGSKFLRSCRVLENAKEMGGDEVVTKSGLMTGLGETKEELLETFGVLREHGVQVLTVGQYLRPTENHLPVVRYWHPDEFAELEREAYAMGFESVAAGPLVRSSYHAEQTLAQASTATAEPMRRRDRRRRDPRGGGAAIALAGGSRTRAPSAGGAAAVAARRAPRSAPRGSAATSTWSAASSSDRRRRRARWRATTWQRDRWRRVRSLPIGVNHAGGRRPRRLAVRRRRLHGAARLRARATARLYRYDPRRNRWRRLRDAPDRARRAHDAGDRRAAVRWSAASTRTARPRALEIYDVERNRWRSGPGDADAARAPGQRGRAAGACTCSPGARRAGNFATLEVVQPAHAALGDDAADAQGRAAGSRPPRSTRGASSCSAARRAPGTITRGRALRRRAARRWSALADMRTPRHGLGGVAYRGRVYALEGGPEPGFAFSNAVEALADTLIGSLLPIKDDIPTRRFPVVTVVLIVINVVVFFGFQVDDLVARRRASSKQDVIDRVRRDPVRDHAPRRPVRARPGPCATLRRRGRGGHRACRRRSSRSSPRCSCTAGCCTSAATCCSSGSSGTTSRTR